MEHLPATLIAALTLCAVSPAGLAASPADEVRQQVVKFADLDLTRPAGVQELYYRIRYAARDVCRTSDRFDDRDCIEQAIAHAIADVDAPLLTRQHQASTQWQRVPQRQARLDP